MTNWMKKILATLCALALLLSCAAADSPEIPDIEAEDLELTQDEIAEPDNSQEENNDDDESEIIVSEVKSLSDEIEQAEGKQEEEQKEEPQEEDSAEDTVPADEAGKPEEPDEIILNLNGRKTIRGSASQTNPYIVKATDDYSRTVLFTLTVPTENNISVTLNDKTLTLTKTDTEESIQYTFTCRLKKDEATSLFLTAREGTVSFTLTISKLEITEEPAEETKEEAEEITEEPEEGEEPAEEEETTETEQPKEEKEESQEETAEEQTKEDIKQPEEKAIEEPAEEPVDEPADETEDEPVEETEEEPIQEPEEVPQETDSKPNDEKQTEVQKKEQASVQMASVPKSVHFTISYDNGLSVFGEYAHFNAYLTGFDGIEYILTWQCSYDGFTWIDTDYHDEMMDIEITEESCRLLWRVKIDTVD